MSLDALRKTKNKSTVPACLLLLASAAKQNPTCFQSLLAQWELAATSVRLAIRRNCTIHRQTGFVWCSARRRPLCACACSAHRPRQLSNEQQCTDHVRCHTVDWGKRVVHEHCQRLMGAVCQHISETANKKCAMRRDTPNGLPVLAVVARVAMDVSVSGSSSGRGNCQQ